MAITTEGTAFKRGDGATPTENFVTVASVRSVSGVGGGSPSIHDVTTLQDSYRKKLVGIRDEGQATLELVWESDDAQFQGMAEDRANGTKRNFQIEWPDGTVDSFSAYVLTFERVAETDAALVVNCTLEIDGAVTTDWPS